MTDKVYELKKALKEFAMVGIQEDLILFDDLTVYNEITGEEEQFKNIEAIVEKYPDMVIELFDSYEGGRGQKSKGKKSPQKLVDGTKKQRGGTGKSLPTATFNNQGRYVDTQKTLKAFQKKHKNENREYGLAINEQGFVTNYTRGQKHSVRIDTSSAGKNFTTIHNHPSGSLFSVQDTRAFTARKNEKSMYITTNAKNSRLYGVTKGNNFNYKDFSKAYKQAVKGLLPQNVYNRRALKFLRNNQEKYGYTFTQS